MTEQIAHAHCTRVVFLWLMATTLFASTRFWKLSYRREVTAQQKLGICVVSSESLLLACTKYGSRRKLRLKFGPLSAQNTPAWAFKWKLLRSAYAISTKIHVCWLSPTIFPTSIQCRATICPSAKRHLNGVSLADR